MSEPATKEDLDAMEGRLNARLDTCMSGFRQQQSVEHDAQLAKLSYITEILVWLRSKWNKFGLGKTWPGDSQ